MRLGFLRRCFAFEHLFDEINPAARAVEFVADQLIGWASGKAKSAMHARAQNRVGFPALWGVEMGLRNVCLHIQETLMKFDCKCFVGWVQPIAAKVYSPPARWVSPILRGDR